MLQLKVVKDKMALCYDNKGKGLHKHSVKVVEIALVNQLHKHVTVNETIRAMLDEGTMDDVIFLRLQEEHCTKNCTCLSNKISLQNNEEIMQ